MIPRYSPIVYKKQKRFMSCSNPYYPNIENSPGNTANYLDYSKPSSSQGITNPLQSDCSFIFFPTRIRQMC